MLDSVKSVLLFSFNADRVKTDGRMVRIVNKLYPCYPAFSFKKADCRCQKCTEADCVFFVRNLPADQCCR